MPQRTVGKSMHADRVGCLGDAGRGDRSDGRGQDRYPILGDQAPWAGHSTGGRRKWVTCSGTGRARFGPNLEHWAAGEGGEARPPGVEPAGADRQRLAGGRAAEAGGSAGHSHFVGVPGPRSVIEERVAVSGYAPSARP